MNATVRYEMTTGCTAAGVLTVTGDVLNEDSRYLVVVTNSLCIRIPHSRVIDIKEQMR